MYLLFEGGTSTQSCPQGVIMYARSIIVTVAVVFATLSSMEQERAAGVVALRPNLAPVAGPNGALAGVALSLGGMF